MPFATIFSCAAPAWASFLDTACSSLPSITAIFPSVAPTPNSSPSGARIVSTPLASASISLFSLSVSTSQIGSPAVTTSPFCLCQRTKTPEVIVMPSLGIVTSRSIAPPCHVKKHELEMGALMKACLHQCSHPSQSIEHKLRVPPRLFSPGWEDRHLQAQD